MRNNACMWECPRMASGLDTVRADFSGLTARRRTGLRPGPARACAGPYDGSSRTRKDLPRVCNGRMPGA